MGYFTYFVELAKETWKSIQEHLADMEDASKRPRTVPVAVEAAAMVATAALTYKNTKTAVCCMTAVKGAVSTINGFTAPQVLTASAVEAVRVGSLALIGDVGDYLSAQNSSLARAIPVALHGVLGASMALTGRRSPAHAFVASAAAKLTSTLTETVAAAASAVAAGTTTEGKFVPNPNDHCHGCCTCSCAQRSKAPYRTWPVVSPSVYIR